MNYLLRILAFGGLCRQVADLCLLVTQVLSWMTARALLVLRRVVFCEEMLVILLTPRPIVCYWKKVLTELVWLVTVEDLV